MRARVTARITPLFLALASFACGKRPAQTDAAPSATASAVAPAASCAEGRHALEQHVATGASTCAADGDCACVDLPQAEAAPGQKERFCGLVVPKSQAGALREENDRLTSAGCAPSGTCPATPCEAMCVPRRGGNFCDKRTRCKEITVQADALVKRLDLACKRDTDCAGYPAGIGQNCGGVGNRASVAPILELAREFRERSCGYATNCAPRQVTRPACSEGMCVGAPLDRGRN
ncbi:MAG TPA: hypothetical protein VLT33_06225 [Labilithrix sp.]|nr:hypothetical protein [Labilithrix sp.]